MYHLHKYLPSQITSFSYLFSVYCLLNLFVSQVGQAGPAEGSNICGGTTVTHFLFLFLFSFLYWQCFPIRKKIFESFSQIFVFGKKVKTNFGFLSYILRDYFVTLAGHFIFKIGDITSIILPLPKPRTS